VAIRKVRGGVHPELREPENAPCILALPRVRFPVELYARPHEGGWAGRGEPETLRGARACDIDEVPLPTAARR
jgi:hypothetical protein